MDITVERFHQDAVVVDCHHDLLLLVARDRLLDERDSFRKRWIPELRAGGIDVQVLPIHIEREFPDEAALRRTLLLTAYLFQEVAANREEVVLCENGNDIDAAVEGGKIALLLALEGSQAIGRDVELIELFYRLGVRMASFSWFGRTPLADGGGEQAAGGRLTHAGVDALHELERLGIVMDVSHLSDASTDHVLELATRPVVASHSCARALLDHHRNLRDDQIRAIAMTGGVVGINFLPVFIDRARPTIDRVVDHVEHMVSVAGVDHVGIGTDFVRQLYDDKFPGERAVMIDGFDARTTIPGLERPQDMPRLTEALLQRGLDEDAVRKILGGNFLRLFRAVIGRASANAHG
jgi:membrane dipeptidase